MAGVLSSQRGGLATNSSICARWQPTELCLVNKTIFDRFAADTGVSIKSMLDFDALFATCNLYYGLRGRQCSRSMISTITF